MGGGRQAVGWGLRWPAFWGRVQLGLNLLSARRQVQPPVPGETNPVPPFLSGSSVPVRSLAPASIPLLPPLQAFAPRRQPEGQSLVPRLGRSMDWLSLASCYTPLEACAIGHHFPQQGMGSPSTWMCAIEMGTIILQQGHCCCHLQVDPSEGRRWKNGEGSSLAALAENIDFIIKALRVSCDHYRPY